MLFRDLFMRSEFGSYDDDWIATLERKKKRRPRSLQNEGGAGGVPGGAGAVPSGQMFAPAGGYPAALGKNPYTGGSTAARTVPAGSAVGTVGGSHMGSNVMASSTSPRALEKKPSGLNRIFSFLTLKVCILFVLCVCVCSWVMLFFGVRTFASEIGYSNGCVFRLAHILFAPLCAYVYPNLSSLFLTIIFHFSDKFASCFVGSNLPNFCETYFIPLY